MRRLFAGVAVVLALATSASSPARAMDNDPDVCGVYAQIIVKAQGAQAAAIADGNFALAFRCMMLEAQATTLFNQAGC